MKDSLDRRATPRQQRNLECAEYAPLPVPRLPLCVRLPAEFCHDPRFVLLPYVTAGTLSPGAHIGVLGRMVRAGEKLAVCYDHPFVHGYFGPPGQGKTYG